MIESREYKLRDSDGKEHRVTVSVDWDDIANRVGYAAIRNKSGRAESVHGAVIALKVE